MSRNFNHCSFLALVGREVPFLLIISRRGEKEKKRNKQKINRVHGGERTRKIIAWITEREDCLAVRVDYCNRGRMELASSSQGGSPS